MNSDALSAKVIKKEYKDDDSENFTLIIFDKWNRRYYSPPLLVKKKSLILNLP